MDNSSSIINQLLIGHKLSCEAKYRHALKSRIFSAHFFLCQICNWSKTLFKSLIFRNVLSIRVIERKKIQYEFDCPVLYIREKLFEYCFSLLGCKADENKNVQFVMLHHCLLNSACVVTVKATLFWQASISTFSYIRKAKIPNA